MTSERVSHLGSSAFAPVGRGTADHPDRDRQRDEHTADRRPDRQTRLHDQPRNQTQHMVPVQRERTLDWLDAHAFQLQTDAPVPVAASAVLERLAHELQQRCVLVGTSHGVEPVVVRAARDADHGQQASGGHAELLTGLFDEDGLLAAGQVFVFN